jgi:hypothetical protein
VSGVLAILGDGLAILGVFLASTVVFDVVHATLHACLRARAAPLRALGSLHGWHHRFADCDLQIHEEWTRQNLRWHVIPEYLTHVSFSALLLLVLPTRWVIGALAIQTLVFVLILRARGMDINHRSIRHLRAYPPSYFCMPQYHALHHAWVDAHYSSWIKTLDHALGTGTQLAGRSVAWAESAGGKDDAFASALADELARIGARPLGAAHDDHEGLRDLDILVVRGDAGESVGRFAKETVARRLPPEVWAVAPRAATTTRYWRDPRVLYRHLDVPAEARRDPAAARTAARRTLSGVRRGFNWVPAAGWVRGFVHYLQVRWLGGGH